MAVIVPFPVPEGVTSHQSDVAPDTTAVQDKLDDTLKVVVPAVVATVLKAGVTDK